MVFFTRCFKAKPFLSAIIIQFMITILAEKEIEGIEESVVYLFKKMLTLTFPKTKQ